MRTALSFALALLATVSTIGWSQAAGDDVPVELAAARHVLKPYGGLAVMLDPAFATAGTAPGARTSQLRDSAQTARLAAALGARLASSPDTGALYLILSPGSTSRRAWAVRRPGYRPNR